MVASRYRLMSLGPPLLARRGKSFLRRRRRVADARVQSPCRDIRNRLQITREEQFQSVERNVIRCSDKDKPIVVARGGDEFIDQFGYLRVCGKHERRGGNVERAAYEH